MVIELCTKLICNNLEVGDATNSPTLFEANLNLGGSVRMDKDGLFKYYFVLRDHLGNTRVTFSDWNNDDEINEKEEIIQINNYYAFGLNMEGNWNGKDGANKYQYNGKEWNDDFGLGWNDYGARFYDPAMARWQTVDPLAETYFQWSAYHYTMGDPINYVDRDGMSADGVGVNSTGRVVYDDNKDDGNYYYFGDYGTGKEGGKKFENMAEVKKAGVAYTTVAENFQWKDVPEARCFVEAVLYDIFRRTNVPNSIGTIQFQLESNNKKLDYVASAVFNTAVPDAGRTGYNVTVYEPGKYKLNVSKTREVFNFYKFRSHLSHEGFHFIQALRYDNTLNGRRTLFMDNVTFTRSADQREVEAYNYQIQHRVIKQIDNYGKFILELKEKREIYLNRLRP